MTEEVIEKRTQIYRDQSSGKAPVPTATYQGIPEQCRAGLLAHVAEHLEQSLPRGAKIVDLAAGTGALALRLADRAYRVECVDYVAENFRLHGRIPFRRLDLNVDFAHTFLEKPQAVVATEIIEHLENPRHFLRQIAQMLPSGGMLFLTTPNVDSPVSKAFSLAFGFHAWFSESDYKVTGHITPIHVMVLKQIAREAGFEIEHLGSFANAWDAVARWPKMRWYARVVAALDRTPKELRGDVLVAALRKR